MLHCCNHRFGHYTLLIAVGIALFFVNLGGASLWDVDEGRNSEAALEMLASHNWVVPTFGGILRVDKPALLYWLQATAYQFFGINEFAARLPSALAALATVLLCYELGRRLFRAATGLLGALVVASTPMFCAAARFANPDALLNCFTVLTLLLFWLGYPRARWWWFVSMGASMGLAVLAKGPVGLVLPMTVMGLFLLWQRQLRLLLNRKFLLGFVAFCLVGLPWYIFVGIETKAEFLRGFLLKHNVDRFKDTMENHSGTLLYYLIVMIVGFAPWSLFFVATGWYSFWSVVRQPWERWRKWWENAADHLAGAESAERGAQSAANACAPRSTLRAPLATPATLLAHRFLFCWIGVYVAFFSLAATKLPNYVLPIYVPTAILIGRFLDRWRSGLIQPARWLLQCSVAGLGVAGIGIGIAMALAGGLIRMDFMNEHYVDELEKWAVLGLIPVAGAVFAWFYLRRGNANGVIASMTIATVLFAVPLAGWATITLNRHKAPRALVEQAGALQRRREIRIGCWQLEHLPSLNFYCQRDVKHYTQKQDAVDFLRYPIQVFLFTPEPEWRDMEKQVHSPHRVVGRHRDMYHGCDVVVVTNRD